MRELEEKRAREGWQKPWMYESLVIKTDDRMYLDEYPLSEYVSVSDKDIKDDRMNPRELV